jgi:hypothetical protein
MIDIIIKILHLALVFFIIISPLVDLYEIKINVLILLIYILFQYLTGYNRCGLTELEYYFMKEDYQQGFLYRIINPLINVSEKYFDYCLYIVHIIYILILIYQIYFYNKSTK